MKPTPRYTPHKQFSFERPTATTRPSPLAPESFRRPAVDRSSPHTAQGSTRPVPRQSVSTPANTNMASDTVRACVPPQHLRQPDSCHGGEQVRSWSSLLEAARHSALSRESHSANVNDATDAMRRWSWRRLLNDPGVSFRNAEISNRLSADTSSLQSWPEYNPNLPVGVALGGSDSDSTHIRAGTREFDY